MGLIPMNSRLSSDTPVLADATDATARIGEDISYKGVPYYQAQLNEFVRTYAQGV